MSANRSRAYRFSIHLSQQQFLRYYQGAAASIQVTSECGKRLRFPAARLRPFLTQNGIQGRFQLNVNSENRFLDLVKLV